MLKWRLEKPGASRLDWLKKMFALVYRCVEYSSWGYDTWPGLCGKRVLSMCAAVILRLGGGYTYVGFAEKLFCFLGHLAALTLREI